MKRRKLKNAHLRSLERYRRKDRRRLDQHDRCCPGLLAIFAETVRRANHLCLRDLYLGLLTWEQRQRYFPPGD